ncbi:MAG: hypothetical protein IIC22_01805, partial [Chloroflexi bacterium]|nr:hypothetical protein [Chloroflexota bacterium]
MVEAFITPTMLRWARQRSYETTDEAASFLSLPSEKLAAWESGAARPTIRQAQKLAKRLKIPFGYLYLSSPPLERLPLPDLRTVAGEQPRTPSPDFSDLLNDVLLKQQWYREHQQEEEDAEPIPFIGRFTLDDDAEEIAEDIRNTLGINEEMRQESVRWQD